MSRVISYEEACALDRVWDGVDIEHTSIFKEANENGNCDIYMCTSTNPVSIDLVYKYDLGTKNGVGIYIVPRPRCIDTWEAYEYNGEIRAGLHFVDGINPEASLNEIINKTIAAISVCPVCGKSIPFNEQHRYSFAGRCCIDCLPSMREKYEQPGWYN